MSDLPRTLRERGMTQMELARILDVDKSAVSRWARGRVPAERVVEIERMTGIPRSELRPDLYAAAQPELAQRLRQ